MPDRSTSARTAVRGLTLTVDVVLLTPRGNELAVLLAPAGTPASGAPRPRARIVLPADAPRAEESLDETALRVARDVIGVAPAFLEQAGALGGAKRQLEGPNVAITYFGLVPDASGARRNAEWVSLSEVTTLPGRQREQVDLAIA